MSRDRLLELSVTNYINTQDDALAIAGAIGLSVEEAVIQAQ